MNCFNLRKLLHFHNKCGIWEFYLNDFYFLGINPNIQVIDKLFNELISFTAKIIYTWLIFHEVLVKILHFY